MDGKRNLNICMQLDHEFANKMQRAMTRAMLVIGREQLHHSFCVRAPTMIAKYKEDWPLAWHEKWPSLTASQQEVFRGWFDQIGVVERMATEDIEIDYETAKRRSIILLADLSENYTEVLLQLLISKGLGCDSDVKRLTGFKKAKLSDPRSIRKSVRNWERTQFPNLHNRTDRIFAMMNQFMPFAWASDIHRSQMDEIFHHRNRLTHEIIQIGDMNDDSAQSADATNITLSAVDSYFVTVGEFIGSTLNGFKSLVATNNRDISH